MSLTLFGAQQTASEGEDQWGCHQYPRNRDD